MGSLIKEYGKLVIIVLFIVSLFAILIGSDEESLWGQLSQARPKISIQSKNNINQMIWLSERTQPVLNVRSTKLKEGEAYQFKDFVDLAVDMEGTPLEIQITKIIDCKRREHTEEVVIVEKGFYYVTYQIVDAYHLKTMKTICFVVD
ncbi:MAG: hypothetical protein RSD97_06445 [Lachnospiraceae bacterium]